MAPIKDHPLRSALNSELHARPFPTLKAPHVAVFVAIKQAIDAVARDRSVDVAHLSQLLQHYGAPLPDANATHYYGPMGKYWIKWEQHTEFVTYTAFAEELSTRPFDPAEFDVFPEAWLNAAPGQRLTSALLRLMPKPEDHHDISNNLNDWFVPESLAAAEVLEGAAVVATDFRIDPAGHLRFALFAAPQTGERRLGRIVQRLFEIETYKSMSMLGFAKVRENNALVGKLDSQLTTLMAAMTAQQTTAEQTLDALLDVSVELEALVAATAYRFGATGAYEAIVYQRIAALREEGFWGRQGFGEFMMRRYEPAMRTVKSAEARLAAMSARAVRASELLRTRVDVERSAQNQAILASLDSRADLQLRLQHTVEGLSVVAISYYAVSLAGYLIYPLEAVTGQSKSALTAIITLPIIAAVWWALRWLRRRNG